MLNKIKQDNIILFTHNLLDNLNYIMCNNTKL